MSGLKSTLAQPAPRARPANASLRGRAGSPCEACAVWEVAVCSALEDDELGDLDAILQRRQLAANAVLFDEGEVATQVYNVTDGCLKLFKLLPDGRKQVTGFMFAGDFVGLANSETYICSAEAVTEVALCCFDKSKLDGLAHKHRNFEKRLLGRARSELAETQNQMLLLGRKSAEERLASFVLMLSGRAALRGAADNPVTLPMSGKDIGDYLGLTTETVSRTWARLQKSKVIDKDAARSLTVVDFEKLQNLADGFKLI
jgi:CRP/FNR family transcriptional regulator